MITKLDLETAIEPSSEEPSSEELERWIQARRERAVRLLARREHSLQELRQKLLTPPVFKRSQPKKQPEITLEPSLESSLIEEILAWLLELELQSDTRFLDFLANKILRQGKGPLALQKELYAHQLASHLVSAKLAQLEDLWSAQIKRVRIKKFGSLPPKDQRQAAKMHRFLTQRGFRPQQIRQAVFLDF